MKKPICLNIDEETLKKIDDYSRNHVMSRSVLVREIINEFFLNKEG